LTAAVGLVFSCDPSSVFTAAANAIGQ
jgi:hypothetical protein